MIIQPPELRFSAIKSLRSRAVVSRQFVQHPKEERKGTDRSGLGRGCAVRSSTFQGLRCLSFFGFYGERWKIGSEEVG